MRVGQVIGIALISAAAVLTTDVLMRTSLLSLLRPRILSPADGAIVTGSVSVSWEGAQPMQATLTGNGQRADLGLRESPFEIDASHFPRPGQYGIELRAARLGSFIGAERRFMVRRGRERTTEEAVNEPPPAEPPPPAPPPAGDATAAQLQAERDQLSAQVEALQGQLSKLREDNADLSQSLDEQQSQSEARLAAAEQEREALAREHSLALQENQFLRSRMDAIPPCTVWGYMAYPRPQTSPPSRLVLVSDRTGAIFRSEADCSIARRTDPGGVSPCACVGAVWGGGQ
jgi:hypothetical protein